VLVHCASSPQGEPFASVPGLVLQALPRF
jgi:hypothetical protein